MIGTYSKLDDNDLSVKKSNKSGRLKIFFGYAHGVGKTAAMLNSAHEALLDGVDVVIGYVDTNVVSPELLNKFECLVTKQCVVNNQNVGELDLELALKRRPQLLVVDELAHTNVNKTRHTQRYQDVQELLTAGIDVYTTVNVQEIESLTDWVSNVIGVTVENRIPDSVFDTADQVELVDIEPVNLLNRLNDSTSWVQGYKRDIIQSYTLENLTALREIALRRHADRVNRVSEIEYKNTNAKYCTDEHILVCLSSSPSNAKIVRTASRMAAAFKGRFTALFVETVDFPTMNEFDKKRLKENMHLAQQLGANIEIVYGQDIPFQIAEFARLSSVSKIVIGRSSVKKRNWLSRQSLTEKLIDYAPNLDIYVIPDVLNESINPLKNQKMKYLSLSISDIVITILILLIATFIGMVFARLGFTEANIITVYILGVLITSLVTKAQVYSFISSIVSVLVFNFFFTVPKFTFQAYDKGYPVTFIIMFIAAFLTGSLAKKLKSQAKKSAESAFRTQVLFETNQLLQKAEDDQRIIEISAHQLMKLLNRNIVIYPIVQGDLSFGQVFSSAELNCDLLTKSERCVAQWVFKNNKHAGATTQTFATAHCLYLSIRVNDSVYGVVGIHIQDVGLDPLENSVMLSILGECALALENKHNAYEKEQAAILAKNEQLRANLLRAISHDLRTPLTSISGNASNLLSNEKGLSAEEKQGIYRDIYDDSMWLINLVENLLSVTRIEQGRMSLNICTELVEEVINEALKHISRLKVEHTIRVVSDNELLFAQMDAKLIVQVIINIVDNAIKYTQKRSLIEICYFKKDEYVVIEIKDNGSGIDDESKLKVFDMFYCGMNKIADSRRSLGLGLSLCKSIVNAHKGKIWVKDNEPSGTIFGFSLPIAEVKVHE